MCNSQTTRDYFIRVIDFSIRVCRSFMFKERKKCSAPHLDPPLIMINAWLHVKYGSLALLDVTIAI